MSAVTRAIGLDLGLSATGFSVMDMSHGIVAEPRPLLVTRGYIKPPASCVHAQAKADYIVDEVLAILRRFPGAVFIEQPITNAWGQDKSGQRRNMTNATSALAKGRLVGSVETSLRKAGIPYEEIGIHRWRAILGLEARCKEDVVKELIEWCRVRGIAFPKNVKADEVEAVGVAASGLLALADPRMLAGKRKRPKKAKAPKGTTERGLFDGRS